MFTKVMKTLFYVTLLLSTIQNVHSYPQYNNNFPNGNTVPPSAIELGHPGGATKRYTAIANQYISNGRKWSRALCISDADGDGQSNGLEMGDPCCTWVQGASPMFTASLSDPNNPASTTKNTNQSCV